MKIFYLFLFLLLSSGVKAQFKADGFFIQDHLYIDPYLLVKYRMDSFQIRYQPHHYINYYLDSSGSVFKMKFISQKGNKDYLYHNNGLNRYSCYYFPIENIICDSNNKIISGKFKKAKVNNTFDIYGRLQRTVTKYSGIKEAKRYYYNRDGSLDRVIIDSGELNSVFQYYYADKRLLMIRLSSSSLDLDLSPEKNQANFDYYNSGLLKSKHGSMYNLLINLNCTISYYSKGKIVE